MNDTSRKTIALLAKATLMAGAVGVVVVAPNALQAFEIFTKPYRGKRANKSYANYAKRSGYFKTIASGDTVQIKLTKKGQTLARKQLFNDYVLPKHKDWDGKWRIMLFDIPEQHAKTRVFIARKLRTSGMHLLQDSIYIYPFDVSELHQTIITVFPHLAQHIIVARVDTIQSDVDHTYRRLFSLS